MRRIGMFVAFFLVGLLVAHGGRAWGEQPQPQPEGQGQAPQAGQTMGRMGQGMQGQMPMMGGMGHRGMMGGMDPGMMGQRGMMHGRMGGHADSLFGASRRPLITIMLHHRADLGLTPEQVKKLDALRADFAREAARKGAEIRVAEIDLTQLQAADPVDMGQVEAKVKEIAGKRAELRLARIRTIEQGKALLTAEQREKLKGIVEGQGPRGMGPGRSS